MSALVDAMDRTAKRLNAELQRARRERIATAVLQGMLANDIFVRSIDREATRPEQCQAHAARIAVEYADALIKALDEEREG